ncbi:helix-turn-helix domain-containing protein [Herbaspirillum sp. RV1423]|uniref:helix-turn-helix domain-containing protein n=1 Tax=Herbaspirillum sp. RV1423 TaxID=1443993 RepID=UPI00358F4B36
MSSKKAPQVLSGWRRWISRIQRIADGTPSNSASDPVWIAARVMLEGTQAPLKTVAYRCGFRDAGYMRVAFLRRLGISAQQYRDNFTASQPCAGPPSVD